MEKIKVMQVGIGPIGQKIVQYMAERDNLQIVAAVDPAPDKAGRKLADLCSLDKALGVTISPDIATAVERAAPDVAVVATVSGFRQCVPLIEEILKHKIHVVSTCEEMAWPWDNEPELAQQLDNIAKQHKVAASGTGVNPGFLMDFLPTAMTAVCKEVKSVKGSRLQDA